MLTVLPYVAAWVAGRRVKGVVLLGRKGWCCCWWKFDQQRPGRKVLPERRVRRKHALGAVGGDMMLGVSRMLESKVTLSSKEKSGRLAVARRGWRKKKKWKKGRWKSICCE